MAYFKWITIGGSLGFAIIVTILHIVQPHYNPIEQQMSELALGEFGALMFFAFLFLSLSIFALSLGLRAHQAPVVIRVLLVAASVGILGGGVFRLDVAPNTHIVSVSLAFVLLVLVMYLLPNYLPYFNSNVRKTVSWVSAAGTAIFIGLGQNVLSMGISQRGAVLFVIVWLIFIGSTLMVSKVGHDS